MNLLKSIKGLFPNREILPGHYSFKVISLASELKNLPILPKELVYLLKKDKTHIEKISQQLTRASLGLRTIEKTPEIVLDAVNNISVISQHRTIIPWLRPLLKENKKPVFNEQDYESAAKANVNLDDLVDTIYSRRFDFKQFTIIDQRKGAKEISKTNGAEDVKEISIDYSIRSIDLENCPESIGSIIKEILILNIYREDLDWLSNFLNKDIFPVFSPKEYKDAKSHNINLDELFKRIELNKTDLRKYLIKDANIKNQYLQDLKLIEDLNSEIEDIALEYAIQRITFDNADTRTAVSQTIIKSLLLIGPITHVLEKYVQGIGKVFAATTDDILSETAELFALRGSGFSWKMLLGRLKLLVPVFFLATYGAFEVETLIELNLYFLAGLLFGASAVALSLTTAILSIKMYKRCIDDLIKENKIQLPSVKHGWRLALKQDFTNPARLGLFMGSCSSPLGAMVVFGIFPSIVHNGWVLALLGSTETIVAGLTVIIARKINDLMYKRIINRYIENFKNPKKS